MKSEAEEAPDLDPDEVSFLLWEIALSFLRWTPAVCYWHIHQEMNSTHWPGDGAGAADGVEELDPNEFPANIPPEIDPVVSFTRKIYLL